MIFIVNFIVNSITIKQCESLPEMTVHLLLIASRQGELLPKKLYASFCFFSSIGEALQAEVQQLCEIICLTPITKLLCLITSSSTRSLSVRCSSRRATFLLSYC